MKKSNFTESKIISILKQQETGRTVAEICREYGISQATFFNWKNKYGGMNPSQLKRLKELDFNVGFNRTHLWVKNGTT